MKNYSPLAALFCALFLAACSKDPAPPAVRTIENVREDFAHLDISPGIHDVQLEFLDSKVWNFRIIAPAVAPGTAKPLIFHLHGASGGDPNAHKQTDCYVEPGLQDLDAFIISPNGGTLLWPDLPNQEQVIQLALLAKAYWPVSPGKIAVMGYSNGGNGAWFFGETQPKIFSAAIPIASSYSTLLPNGSVRIMPVPMYVIHGENDELFPVAETQNWVQLTKDAGSDVTLVVAPGLTHNKPCDYVPYIRDAVTWLEDVAWK